MLSYTHITKARIAYALLCSLLAAPIESAYAVRQYRCAGRVQYRPCDTPAESVTSTPRSKPTRPLKQTALKIAGPRYAEIRNTSFVKVDRAQGLWKGRLKGNGFVETELQIFRNDHLEERRYMGSVWLRDKETPFRFKSALPTGQNWEWLVVASVR